MEGGRIQKSRPKSHKKPASLPLRDCREAQHDAWPAWEQAGADRRTAALRASIRAADDVLEADLPSDKILACFEEALGERLPEMGTDAAAGREANAESAEACTATGGCSRAAAGTFPACTDRGARR